MSSRFTAAFKLIFFNHYPKSSVTPHEKCQVQVVSENSLVIITVLIVISVYTQCTQVARFMHKAQN